MSWKKNVFSYLLWVFYAVAAEVVLVCLVDALCDSIGVEIYIGTIACALYIVLAGAGVYLIHRFTSKYSGADEKNHSGRAVIEAAVTVALLATGLVLRAQGAGGAGEENAYYELAAMVSEEAIPQFAHGAVCFYIQMLHGLFYFLGNKPAVAVWVQILLQMSALLLLYFAARQFAGRIAAIVMLGFGMFSTYLMKEASVLSPAMLYLFFWAAVLLLIVRLARVQKNLWGFPALGLVIAFVSYLDVAGCLLLLITAAVIFCEEKEKPEAGRRWKCLLLCLAGAGVGFAGCALVDSLMGGESFTGVMEAWVQLYGPSDLSLPVSLDVQGTMAGAMAEYILLFCVLTLGMFSFWRSRRRDYMKAWILLLIVLALAGCFGVFTEEMPMGLYMYLLLTVMAGIAVERSICKVTPVHEEVSEMPAEVVPQSVGEAVSQPQGEAGGGSQPDRETAPQSHGEAGGVRQPDKGTAPQPQGEVGAVQQQTGETAPKSGDAEQPGTKKVQFIENPLPLPKKHVKRTLDYGVAVPEGKDDFDLVVDEKDDFDI